MTQMMGKRATTAYTRRLKEGSVPFVRCGGFEATEHRCSVPAVMATKLKETWELDIDTYNNGVNAVDWHLSR